MNLLLDTNVVVWMLSNPRRLNAAVRQALEKRSNQLYVSAASVLEMTSKASSGRLVFNERMRSVLMETCTSVPVLADHALLVQMLPLIHRDPFDRVIVAQAMIEDLTLVTGDHLLAEYGAPVILT
ncbi:type II toxin-antitoxin system VapC family toxin [Brevundimonas bacteroides]|uniref:type II toxin-antitoxin system VapC family toxin n=1 Tax=Brevundimonas bacteroides TaxID=74311 RepID=UPI0004958610|nr:type II toxin-antitoxin system VapC family toxin [Brevundimonas bacteroides]